MGILVQNDKGKDQWFYPWFVDKGICTQAEWRAACEEVAGWLNESLPSDLRRNRNRPPDPKGWGTQKRIWKTPYGSIEKPEPYKGECRYIEGHRRRYNGQGQWLFLD